MARFSIFASYMLDNRSLIYMEWTLIEAALPRKGIHYAAICRTERRYAKTRGRQI